MVTGRAGTDLCGLECFDQGHAGAGRKALGAHSRVCRRGRQTRLRTFTRSRCRIRPIEEITLRREFQAVEKGQLVAASNCPTWKTKWPKARRRRASWKPRSPRTTTPASRRARTEAPQVRESTMTWTGGPPPRSPQVRAGERRETYAQAPISPTWSESPPPVLGTRRRSRACKVAWVRAMPTHQQDRLVHEGDGLDAQAGSSTGLLPRMVRDYIGRKDSREPCWEKQRTEAKAKLRQVITRAGHAAT